MNKFYFNECLPDALPYGITFQKEFEKLIEAFNRLQQQKNLKIDTYIVTANLPSHINVCGFNLVETIKNIRKRDLKRIAYSYFTKYPISDYFPVSEVNEIDLIGNNYNFQGRDAINLAIIAFAEGILCTIPIEKSLKENIISLVADDNSTITVNNFFGEPENLSYIERYINAININKLSKFEQLESILGNCIRDKSFEKDFFNADEKVQESIVNHFIRAKDRLLLSSFQPDFVIIKDVTPTNNKKKIKVYELRVFSPIALRVYFYEGKDTVYIAKMAYKADSNDGDNSQNRTIKEAHSTLEKMVLTNV